MYSEKGSQNNTFPTELTKTEENVKVGPCEPFQGWIFPQIDVHIIKKTHVELP